MVILALGVMLPAALAQLEERKEIRAGDLLFNDEIILAPFNYTIFHAQSAAATDTEAFALSAPPAADGGGLDLAQTSDRTGIATETGFFHAFLPNFRIVDFPTPFVGQGLGWVRDVVPLGVAGLPKNTTMTFPPMTMITHVSNGTGPASNASYIINSNYSRPYFPGNMMLAKNVTGENGQNETILERVPRDYMTLIATPEEIANRTIIERMWRDVHINYNLDRAYVGETCFPAIVAP